MKISNEKDIKNMKKVVITGITGQDGVFLLLIQFLKIIMIT